MKQKMLGAVLAVFLLLITLVPAQGHAQRMHHFDIRKFNLGYSVGISLNGYDMTSQINQRDPATGRYLKNVELIRKPGFYVGLITSFKLHNNIDFRFLPGVSLEERDFQFQYEPETNNGVAMEVKKIESPCLNIPMVFKFKSDYYRRVRVYTQLGIQPTVNFATTKKVKNDPDLLKVQNFDVAAYASFGVDLYGERVKLSPEIRFTRGLRNLYVPDRTRFASAISDLFSQVLTLTVNLE